MNGYVAAVGSLILVLIAIGVAVYATKIFRTSIAMAREALLASPSEPLDLTCGIRYRGINASWPEGHVHIDDDGVEFIGLGANERAAWRDVLRVQMVKPMTLIGWGVRFQLLNPAQSIIVWFTSRRLAARVLEAAHIHGAPAESSWRFAI